MTPPQGSRVLVGDFNLYHPLWDRKGCTSRGSEVLLELAERWRLELTTPWGEHTWKQYGKRSSTLDLAWVSRGLRAIYMGDPGYTGSDHTAQVIQIASEAPANPRQAAPKGWSWQKMDREIVRAAAKELQITTSLNSPEALDRAVDALIEQLQGIANRSTPRKRTTIGRSVAWWNGAVDEAVHGARRARRRYAAEQSEGAWNALKEAEQV